MKENNKQASVNKWNSMANGFGEHTLPTFEENRFLQLLEQNQMFDGNSLVLDVGCGTGSYALALSDRCKKVIGVDLSPRMIEIAKEKAQKENVTNIEFYCADWHNMDLIQEGFEKKYNLVFAHMTPAVQSASTFLKLSQASRDWCVLSQPTRRIDPVLDAVKKLVGISGEMENSDVNILYAFGLLWQQGLSPRFEYEQQRWNMKRNLEEAYGLYVNALKTYRDISLEEEQKIIRYLQSVIKDGMICEDVDTMITTLYWQV
nr:class I SAM-dependent methyltransferase [Clostridium simiarum]